MKCLTVGDKGVGKTCMLIANHVDKFPEEYIPSTCDAYVHSLSIGGTPYDLALLDTAGQKEHLPSPRPIASPNPDVYLVCFSVDSLASFESVKNRWVPELKQHHPHKALVLVGTKSDLREDPATVSSLASEQQKCVTREEATELARHVGAYTYTECSALTREGLKNVFEEAVRGVLEGTTSKCAVL